MRRLLHLYPAAWRRRYGPEFAALLEQLRPSPRVVFDVIRGAIDAHRRPEVLTGISQMQGGFNVPESSPRHKSAILGLILLLPALVFLLIASSTVWAPNNPLYSALDDFFLSNPAAFRLFNLVSPMLFLGGSFIAFFVNLVSVLRVDLRTDGRDLVGGVRFTPSALNIGILSLSGSVLAALVLYAVLENWQCIVGDKLAC